jgi:uncharacterized protein
VDFFTQEHLMAREKYGTKKQAEYLLSLVDTTCLNDGLSRYLGEDIIGFIERIPYFFFATSSSAGNTNVNFKGSNGSGLIKVIDKNKLLFPDYGGNGILHSIGDIYSNPHVGILIIDFAKDIRLKLSGTATIIDDKKVLTQYFDYFNTFDIERLVEVEIDYVVPNCSQNISVVRKSLTP